LLRCVDCWMSPLWCKGCCVDVHIHSPFHRVEMWTGRYFKQSSLMDIGYVLHLGCNRQHNDDQSQSTPTSSSVVLVHSTGIFTQKVVWCTCNVPRHLQLLRHRLYPASTKNPCTAFTFDVLEYFYMDALECKTAAMKFYTKLCRFTNNSFPDSVPVSTFLVLE
jgi:hypothetical protein